MMFPWWPNFRTDRPGVPNKSSFENQQDYIDFAADNGIRYLELEPPWYETEPGVEDGKQSPATSNPLKPLPEMRVQELIQYARSKNVGVFLWIHWSLLVHNMDEIMATYQKWGAAGMKVDFFDRDDQEMVGIYQEIARKAAAHKLMVFYHGSYNPTGMQRTWPNVLTYEGVMGNEWNKWSDRVTLKHTLTIPFTRMVSGPMDFTPGGFRNVMPGDFKVNFDLPQVMGTRSRQLAMFVVYESPAQMVCDYPGAYRGQPGLDFLKVVPTNWDETRCLDGAIGEHIVVARRKGDVWYLGAMTDEQPRTLEIPLDFLKAGQTYKVESWSDPASGGMATELARSQAECMGGAQQKLTLRMSAGGGAAMVLTPELR
jgi:alpha-glucosidase